MLMAAQSEARAWHATMSAGVTVFHPPGGSTYSRGTVNSFTNLYLREHRRTSKGGDSFPTHLPTGCASTSLLPARA